MYIFQPDRHLLTKQVQRYSNYIKGRVLDVGAGEYNRYEHLFHCDEYVKMDIFQSENVDVVGSADNIPFGGETFDSVISTQVLEHLKYPEKAVQETSRVLKRGGVCLLTAPQMNELHLEPNDYFRYTKYGLIELFERNGFETVQYDQRGGYHTTIAQMHVRYLIDRFNLHKSRFLGKMASRIFSVYGKYAIWLDAVDNSKANRKHSIGWTFVFRKK